MSLTRLLLEDRPADQPVAWKGRDTVIPWDAFTGGIAALSGEIASSPAGTWVLACPDPVEFLAALFAVWHAGKVPVIPTNYQKENISRACGMADRVIEQVELSPRKRGPASWAPLDHQARKVVLFTSGSSGSPKLVEKTLFQLDSEVLTLEAQWGARLRGLPVVATVPHYHIYGLLFRLLWPVLAGRAFFADDMTMPDVLFSRIRTAGPVVLVSSPAHLTRIPSLIDPRELAPNLACIFSSGAPLPQETAAWYAGNIGMAPVEVYGSTETGGIGWRQGGSAWTPFPLVDIRVSEDGTLEARSPRTERREWVRTEDLARIDEDGRFSLSGRADRIVKIEGKRVSLDEMAARLNDHPWVEVSGIVVLEKARMTLGAAVVLTKEGADQHDRLEKQQIVGRLKDHLAQWFEPVVLPRLWRFVSRLPMTDRGKTAVADLLSLFAEDPEGPTVLSRRKTATSLELSLFVPSTLFPFKGHFPDFPVLPGVLQIHWAALFGTRELNIKGRFSGIGKLKFHRVVLPNTELKLNLVVQNDKLVFSFASHEGVHSSGQLEFRQQA